LVSYSFLKYFNFIDVHNDDSISVLSKSSAEPLETIDAEIVKVILLLTLSFTLLFLGVLL